MFVKTGKGLGLDIRDRPAFCTYHRKDCSLEDIFKNATAKEVKLIIAVLPGKTPYYGEFLVV